MTDILFSIMKLALLFSLLSLTTISLKAAEPAPATKTQEIYFAGGCFWCVEGCYEMVKGVTSVTSGYMGGKVDNPTYEQVCTGTTGHAEAVKVVFDPAVVTAKRLIDLFWTAHNPTTLNRQGNDIGTQYRSAIFYVDETQKTLAEASKTEHAGKFSSPIVTEITAASKFYPAEAYHQDYGARNPNSGYIKGVSQPKMEKMEKALKEEEKKK